MPYAEASANYVLTPSSVLGFEARYGYDDSNTFGSLGKSVRTGVSLTQAFSPKLRGTASLNYSHTDSSEYNGIVADSWSAVSGAVGVQYALSKDLTLFANYSRIQKTSPDNYIEYTKNLYYVGATYQY
jgi:outer membrane receptor protein involved in Fe transport